MKTIKFFLWNIMILCFVKLSYSQTYREAFDALDANLNGGQGFSFYINAGSFLQVTEPPVMDAYLTMYKATKDKHYLDKFVINAKRVQDHRDDDVTSTPYGILNHSCCSLITTIPYNTSSKAWSTDLDVKHCNNLCSQQSYYNEPIDSDYPGWVQRVLHSGTITYPMSEFIYLMKTDPDAIQLLNTPLPNEIATSVSYNINAAGVSLFSSYTYGEFVNWLEYRVTQTILFHEANWCNDIGLYEYDGFGHNCPSHDAPDAMNMQCAMGKTLLMMYLVESLPNANLSGWTQTYIDHICSIAYVLKQDAITHFGTTPANGGYYSWLNPFPSQGREVEDAAHASLSMSFADLCFKNNICGDFNLTDMQLFGNTVANKFYGAPLITRMGVDGSDNNVMSTYSPASNFYWLIGSYVFMTPYNNNIYQIVSDYFSSIAISKICPADAYPFALNAIANLVLYEKENDYNTSCENIFNPLSVKRDNSTNANWLGSVAGDFDGDGVSEFASLDNSGGGNHLKLYAINNVNDNNIHQGLIYNLSGNYSLFAAGDIDLNNAGDEFVLVDIQNNLLEVLKQQGALFAEVAQIATPTYGVHSPLGIGVGEFSSINNGKEIIVSTQSGFMMYSYSPTSHALSIIPIDNSVLSSVSISKFTIGDFNGDGIDDIAVVDNINKSISTYSISYSASTGYVLQQNMFTYIPTLSVPALSISSGDFDGDGTDEIVLFKNLNLNVSGSTFQIYRENDVSGAILLKKEQIFPVDQVNGVMCKVKMNAYPLSDALATFRNYDGQISIFNMDGLCPGLYLNDQTIDDNYSINNPYINANNNYNIDYHVSSTLTAGNNFSIVNPSQVTFTAGKQIILLPGFTAQTGSDFHAYIEPALECNPLTFRRLNSSSTNNKPPQNYTATTKLPVNNAIKITPNPNTGTFELSITKNDKPIGVKEVKVYDIMGKEIWAMGASANNTFKIDISQYAQGVYYVRTVNEQGEIEMKKLLKE